MQAEQHCLDDSFDGIGYGQLECVQFLVEQRGANVNQQDCQQGWTPLHRCARMAHHRHAPFLHIFQYLLDNGANAELMSFNGFEDLLQVFHSSLERTPSSNWRHNLALPDACTLARHLSCNLVAHAGTHIFQQHVYLLMQRLLSLLIGRVKYTSL